MLLAPSVQVLNYHDAAIGVGKQPCVRVPDLIAAAVAVVAQNGLQLQAGLIRRGDVASLREVGGKW